jgi:uncharacterized protein YjbI with pentapeptide repeats
MIDALVGGARGGRTPLITPSATRSSMALPRRNTPSSREEDAFLLIAYDALRETGASLTGASLTGASLTGASLTGASLTGASLTGASLTGVAGAPAAADAASEGWGPMAWRSMHAKVQHASARERKGRALPALRARAAPAELGDGDAFISHSSADPLWAKLEAIDGWATDFRRAAERWPRLWLDLACAEIDSHPDMASIPLCVSGCSAMLVLAG